MQSEDVHGEECQVEAKVSQYKVNFTPGVVDMSSGDFGEPVIDSGEDAEDAPTEEDIVQVGDDEVGIMNVDVKGYGG